MGGTGQDGQGIRREGWTKGWIEGWLGDEGVAHILQLDIHHSIFSYIVNITTHNT